MSEVDNALAELATMTPAQLRDKWQRLIKTPCPRFGPDLLRRAIGHHLQEQAHRKSTSQAAAALRTASGRGASELRSGTRLLRTWNGREVSVLVTDRGFEFEGRNWGSLSAIAREVTGTVWSGPRFFGLTGEMARE